MNIYLNMLRAAGKLPVFEKPNEGNPGGDDAAAKAAAEAAAEAKKKADADEAVRKAKEESDAAAAAAKSGDADAVKLAAEKAELLREVMDKKSKLTATSKELDDTRKALEAYGGIDPEKVKALIKAEADAVKAQAEAAGDFERVKQMMADEHAKERAALEAKLEEEREARKKDRSLIDELTIGNAFGNSTFIKENMVLSSEKTRQLYGSHFDMKDGRLVAYDKPASAANRTMLVNSAGEPLAFEESIERIFNADPDKKTMTKSKVKQGSSSNTSQSQTPDNKGGDDGLYGRSRIAAGLKDFR